MGLIEAKIILIHFYPLEIGNDTELFHILGWITVEYYFHEASVQRSAHSLLLHS